MSNPNTVVVLSEDRSLRGLLEAKLREDGYRVTAPAQPGTAALDHGARAAVVDLGRTLPDRSPLLGSALAMPKLESLLVLVDRPLASHPTSIRNIRVAVLVKPFELDKLSARLASLIRRGAGVVRARPGQRLPGKPGSA